MKPLQTIHSLTANADKTIAAIQSILTAEDILIHRFRTADNALCAAIFTDEMTDKHLLGQLATQPLTRAAAPKTQDAAEKILLFPEIKHLHSADAAAEEVLSGNTVIIIDGMDGAVAVGTKKLSVRAVAEPQTSVTVKGPREGFIEDLKTNMSLVRRRLKTPDLQFETIPVGKRSRTLVSITWLNGIAEPNIVNTLRKRIAAIDIDGIPDSSYIAQLLSDRPAALFKHMGTTEKPDIFCCKLLEGRVGILVDGTPIALTVPYMLCEDFQSAQDYFVSPVRASVNRLFRVCAVLASVFLPALYVAAQLFRLQLLPFSLLMTVSGGIRGIPLSPGLEMFFLLVLLEILIEASIRMPKYVALALSVIGALVIGDTAVKAGLVSSPAIIIIALSGISAYTVPDLIGTISIIRMAFLLTAGSLGTYGIVLLAGLLAYRLTAENSWGTPLLAPFSPLIVHDLRDSAYKANLFSLNQRPVSIRSKNRTRLAK